MSAIWRKQRAITRRLLTDWGKLKVTWWTHKIHGLHRNDYIMAAKTDALARELGIIPREEGAARLEA